MASYDTEVAADSPAIYWKLQDTSGTSAADSSGNSRAGTYNGTGGTNYALNQSVSLLPASPSLKSVKFMRDSGTEGGHPTTESNWADGSTVAGKASVSIAYASWNGMNVAGSAFSCEAWFKYPTASTFPRRALSLYGGFLWSRRVAYPWQFQMPVYSWAGVPYFTRYQDRLVSTNNSQPSYTAAFGVKEAAFDTVIGGGASTGFEQELEDAVPSAYLDCVDDSPHHVVGACGTASIRIYIDGRLGVSYYTSNTPAIPANTSDPLIFGGVATSGNMAGFIGWLSHASFYLSELSAARAAAHYTAGAAKVTFLNQQWQLLAADEMTLSTSASTLTTAGFAQVMLHSDSSTFTAEITPTLRLAVSLAEAVTVAPALTARQYLGVAFLDSASIAQQITTSKFGQVVLSESAAMLGVLTAGQKVSINLADIITAAVIIKAGDEEMVGWIINPNLAASTALDNYAFTGFGQYKGKRYGIRPDGLYVLEGDTDNGTRIDSFISLGNRNFGTAKQKRMRHAYIGASTDGRMVLKVIVNGQEYLYAVKNPSTDMAEQRVDIGRGLRSNYWNFELMNREGADFEIDTIKFMPIVLERRI